MLRFSMACNDWTSSYGELMGARPCLMFTGARSIAIASATHFQAEGTHDNSDTALNCSTCL